MGQSCELIRHQVQQNFVTVIDKQHTLTILSVGDESKFQESLQQDIDQFRVVDCIHSTGLSKRLFILQPRLIESNRGGLLSAPEVEEHSNRAKKPTILFRQNNISLKIKSLMTSPQRLSLTFDQSAVLVAGQHKENVMVTAFEFQREFLYICEFKCKDNILVGFERIFCTDIFVLCTEASMYFLKYENEQIAPVRCMQLVDTLSNPGRSANRIKALRLTP